MKYDSIIIELLARIQALEDRVDELSSGAAPAPSPAAEPVESRAEAVQPPEPSRRHPKVSTADIRAYIQEQKRLAEENGETELVFKASDIHRNLNMKNRIPMVTNAMRQCMGEDDEVLHDTPSGKSSTLEIKYYLNASPDDEAEDDDDEDYED